MDKGQIAQFNDAPRPELTYAIYGIYRPDEEEHVDVVNTSETISLKYANQSAQRRRRRRRRRLLFVVVPDTDASRDDPDHMYVMPGELVDSNLSQPSRLVTTSDSYQYNARIAGPKIANHNVLQALASKGEHGF